MYRIFPKMGLSGPHGYGGLMRHGAAGHPTPFAGGSHGFGGASFPYGHAAATPFGPYGPYGMYGMSGYDQYGNPLFMGGHGKSDSGDEASE
jgi:hypothetical protein